MADSSKLENDAVSLAKLAVENDLANNLSMAIFYYTEAAEALLQAYGAGSTNNGLTMKAKEYILRAEELKTILSNKSSETKGMPIEEQSSIQLGQDRAQYLLKEAMELDASNRIEEAIDLYSESIELLLNVRRSTSNTSTQEKLAILASQALDRAEALKQMRSSSSYAAPSAPDETLATSNAPAAPSTGKPRLSHSPADAIPSSHRQEENRGESYSTEEIAVLRKTSNINGRIYVPFLHHIDLKSERFAFTAPFTDKDGKLELSDKQRRHLSRWVRPAEYCTDPRMIILISSFSIRQTLVTDCSFVASMAIAAQYERRFKKRLITNIIYPQNRNGEPLYNPCGKYMVKLQINGVPRKVTIDDYLPMAGDGELLCSYSTNRNELWVSLLEKAYMKVMGGYDFPGSNSNIDLHALTGWIPERVAISLGSLQFNKDKEFRRLHKKFHQGHCLVTVATGEMDEEEAKRAGLVPTHAYAMLDIQEVEGQRLFLLKNPWSHLRWRGNFSERDTAHWTPKMQKALNYDLNSAQLTDNGVFWIDYDSLCHFFDVIYINWDPELFQHTSCIHSTWSADMGARKDVYTVRDNPQYKLWVRQGSACWILLTRHITDKEDFANNREFMAVIVYRGIQTRRVYYPGDPQPWRDGIRINSPHNLVKLVLDDMVADTAVNGWQCLHLVVSQYEKQNTLHYTLRAYSSSEMRLQPVIDPYKCVRTESGKWAGPSAGGCGNHGSTYYNNPTYQIRLDNSSIDNSLLIELRGPREYAVGFELIKVTANNTTTSNSFDKKHCGPYRRGYVMMEVENFSGGIYNLIVSTYKPAEEGPFILKISSQYTFTISRLK